MIARSDLPAEPEPDPLSTPPTEESASGAEDSPDPYARESAIEQLTGPEDADD
jgi:hypothetical protein